jgi:hypothetical protein
MCSHYNLGFSSLEDRRHILSGGELRTSALREPATPTDTSADTHSINLNISEIREPFDLK